MPGAYLTPESEEELAQIVQQAARSRRSVRMVGAGLSSAPLVKTDDILVKLDKFQQIEEVDLNSHTAVVGAGLTLDQAGRALREQGLSMHNLPNVDMQNVIGALATGTHGTGWRLQNLSTMLIGVRLINGQGQLEEHSSRPNLDFIHAARVSLGVLGIFTKVRLQLLPAYQLRRQEWCSDVDNCLEHMKEQLGDNRNFDFYWYPRSDEVKLRTINLLDHKPLDLPYARLVEEQVGWADEIIPKEHKLRFDEMEYALPAEAGVPCFLEVRARIREKHRKHIGWRVLYRTVALDKSYLSPFYGRQTVTISLRQNAGLPYWEYFQDIEPIFLAYGGRPHWAKKHSLRASQLRPLYPKWKQFMEYRAKIDPQGVFLTPYLRELLLNDPTETRGERR